MTSDCPDNPQSFMTVSCGNATAKLHLDKFLCPGIHKECIETDDGSIVTPKFFAIIGEKEKLKNWKSAIRINGVSIKRQMESGYLDFYNHNEICTGRCMARNYGSSKYDSKIEILKAASKDDDSLSSDLPTLVPLVPNMEDHPYKVLREAASSPVPKEESGGRQGTGSATRSRKRAPTQAVFPTPIPISGDTNSSRDSGVNIKTEPLEPSESEQEEMDQEHGSPASSVLENSPGNAESCNGSPKQKPRYPGRNGGSVLRDKVAALKAAAESKVVKLASEFPDTDTLLEDSVQFWQSMKDVGLLDEFVRDIKHSVESIKTDMMREGISQTDARKLSNVVSELGLITKLKWRLAEHKTQTEVENFKLITEIQALKRKVAVSEQKQKELKRKSDCFDHLMEMSRPKRTPNGTPTSQCSDSSAPDEMD